MEDSRDSKKESRVYETGFLLNPSVSEDEISKEMASVRSLIESGGGAVIAEEFPKQKSLAYKIFKKIAGVRHNFSSAYFGWIKWEEKQSILQKKIKDAFETDKNVIRHIIIKTVRESTLMSHRLRTAGPEGARGVLAQKRKPAEEKEKPTMSEAEVDKAIEQLVIE